MNSIQRTILVAALTAVSIAARAAPPPISTCITPDGRRFYSDNADECKNAETRGLNPDGSQKSLTPAPPTPEQERAKDENDRKQAECRERNRKQYQEEVALLDRYKSEDQIQEERYHALGGQLRLASQASERLKTMIAKGKDLAEQAKFFEPPHPMPADLKSNRDLNRTLEQNEFLIISGAALDIRRINDHYDVELKRYREVVDRTANRRSVATCDLP
jgi:hypothetical protein